MSEARAKGWPARYAWLALIGLCLVLCAVPIACRAEPKRILASIPLGSKLSELDRHLGHFYEDSKVREWTKTPTSERLSAYAAKKYGDSYVRHLGPYDGWAATPAERDTFTGEIVFFHLSNVIPDDLAPSFMITLVYDRGMLRDKDFGYLPG